MESPLDVLSRAATMLQETQPDAEDVDSKILSSGKQSGGSAKWKRDRKCRLPAYSRKSDPKVPETLGGAREDYQNGGGGSPPDSPLDMSVRQRGLPPSYTQTINNPGYRSSINRTSVITSTPPAVVPPTVPQAPLPPPPAPSVNTRDLPSGISMCDPIIDEHFRRSLGKDYVALFSNNNVANEVAKTASRPPPPLPAAVPDSSPTPSNNTTTTTASSVKELMDSSGLSVDDHFAKALGDTWLKLNQKDTNGDIKNGVPPERVVSI